MALLQDLLEGNKSSLAIKGTRSEWLENGRGLPQGSIVAPTLFNFFIDELLCRLSTSDVPQVRIAGLRYNHLAYADDVTLIATCGEHLREMMQVCEDWSLEVGARLAPAKTIILGSQDDPSLRGISIYGEEVPIANSGVFLGYKVKYRDTLGCRVDIADTVVGRAKKATDIVRMLHRAGMNLQGYTPVANAQIYKTFIRPVMEYGLSLEYLPPTAMKELEKAQRIALRTILFGHNSTSIAAMHRLLLMPPMHIRNADLHSRFAHKLHNGTDVSLPSVKIWWQLWNGNVNEIQNRTQKNPWWREVRQRPHLFTSVLQRQPCTDLANFGIPEDRRVRLIRESLQALPKRHDNVGTSVQLDDTEGYRSILHHPMPRAHRATIIRWMIGNIAYHQPEHFAPGGQPCSQEFSRKHALECSGAFHYLATEFPSISSDDSHNLLDTLLNKYRKAPINELPPDFYEKIYQALCMIFTSCLHFQVMPSGWWKRGLG